MTWERRSPASHLVSIAFMPAGAARELDDHGPTTGKYHLDDPTIALIFAAIGDGDFVT